jgi:hypothetical protein
VYGYSDRGTGVYGYGPFGIGVFGTSQLRQGVFGMSTSGHGVQGESTSGYGIFGRSVSGPGISGSSDSGPGISGTSWSGNGVFGTSQMGWFSGAVEITGELIKSGGGFRIDHPLDPAHKYLNHSFVESEEVKNLYDGVVQLDDEGAAWVPLLEWFTEVNRDFRYQLTAIGAAAPELHIAEELSAEDSRFKIGGASRG